jgi:hypothetical protein
MTTAATTASKTTTTTKANTAKSSNSPKTGVADVKAAETLLGLAALGLLFSRCSKRK